MPPLPALRHRQDGVTLAELMAALAILMVLVAIAIPTFFGAANQARDTKAQAALRNALGPLKTINIESPDAVGLESLIESISPGVSFDPAGVAGIKLERSLDGAVCMWRVSESGVVYGVWEPPGSNGESLFGEFAALPATCPETVDALGQGYTINGW